MSYEGLFKRTNPEHQEKLLAVLDDMNRWFLKMNSTRWYQWRKRQTYYRNVWQCVEKSLDLDREYLLHSNCQCVTSPIVIGEQGIK
jgi:hypothetical protein